MSVPCAGRPINLSPSSIRGQERFSSIFEELKISITRHSGRAEKILDDEDGDGAVGRNNKRAPNARLNVNLVVPFLAIEAKAVLLKNADELLVGDGPESGHRLLDTHGEAID